MLNFLICRPMYLFRSSLLHRNYVSNHSLVPVNPIVESKQPLTEVEISESLISHLENLSLVNYANREGIKVLNDAILFAEKVLHINTGNILPMYTVLEKSDLQLRDDIVTIKNSQKSILKNSCLIFEEYFVAPPGNVPLEIRNDLLFKSEQLKSHN